MTAADTVLTDPKRRCLVEELRDHPIAEIVLVLDALGKGHILRNYLWRTDPPMQSSTAPGAVNE